MKKLLVLLALAILIVPTMDAQKRKKRKKNKEKKSIDKQPEVKSEMDKFSYSLGILIAQNFKGQIDSVNTEDLAKGIEDALADKATVALQEANQLVQARFAEAAKKQHEGVLKEGETFLAENGQRKGVTTTASGLQYEVMTEGTGPKPKATDKVKTHYHGTLINGTVFDSSVQRGEAISFPVNGVIQGWQEALQLMPKGSKWKLFVPYNLAYGERGAGANIPPYSTLIFEVELIDIE